MLGLNRTLAPVLVTLCLSACGQSGAPDASSTRSSQPNLRFIGKTVTLLTVPGTPTLEYGKQAIVPCNTGGIRIRYRYGNGGDVGAVAHQNKSAAFGSPAFAFSFGALASGQGRDAIASIGAIVSPNVSTAIAIVLDAGLAVTPETSESDNVFKAFIVRQCP